MIFMINLTQREREVLALLSEGQLDKEIAARLDISIHTAHEHVRNISRKTARPQPDGSGGEVSANATRCAGGIML